MILQENTGTHEFLFYIIVHVSVIFLASTFLGILLSYLIFIRDKVQSENEVCILFNEMELVLGYIINFKKITISSVIYLIRTDLTTFLTE